MKEKLKLISEKIENNKVYPYLVLFFLLLIMMGFYLPSYWLNFGSGDFDLTYFTLEVVRKSLTDYHQIPFWNPWSSGGIDFFANPQTIHYGFLFFLIYFLPTIIAVKITILLHFIIGIFGMFTLLRNKNISVWVSMFGASIFCCTSYFTWHTLAAGHMNTLTILLLPWIFVAYFNFKKIGRLSLFNFIIPVLIYLNLILSGASYPLVFTPIFVFFYALSEYISEKKSINILLYIFFTVIIGYGLSLWKLYPSIRYLSESPRVFLDDTHISIIQLLSTFSDHSPNNNKNTYTYHGWWEYSSYFEIIGFLLLFYFRKTLKISPYLIGFAAFLIWFSMGDIPNHVNPWSLLNKFVPIFNNLRAPSRSIIYVIFLLSIWLSQIIDKNKKDHPLIFMIMLSWIINLTVINYSILASYKESPKVEYSQNKNEFSMLKKEDSLIFSSSGILYHNLKENIGLVNGYEPLPLKYFGFENIIINEPIKIIENPNATLSYFSPNKLIIKTDKPLLELIVNQNFNQGWEIEQGSGTLIEENGLIKIRNPSSEISLVFTPPNSRIGFYLSIPFFVLLLLILFLLSRRVKMLALN